jgi:hypothetical protein
MEADNASLRTCGVCNAGGPYPPFLSDVLRNFISSRLSDGGGQSQPMPPLRANDPRNLLFTDQNAETQLRFVFARPKRSSSGSFSFPVP